MWILLLFLALPDGGATINQVTGFKTQAACQEALKQIPTRVDTVYNLRQTITATCVEVK